jgi:hypothetical protein
MLKIGADFNNRNWKFHNWPEVEFFLAVENNFLDSDLTFA